MAEIKSTDGFSKNLTDHAVAHVYHGFDETISYNTFLTNVVKMQTFWSKKEVIRMLEKPTYNDDINALGFDTSLVRLTQCDFSIGQPLTKYQIFTCFSKLCVFTSNQTFD